MPWRNRKEMRLHLFGKPKTYVPTTSSEPNVLAANEPGHRSDISTGGRFTRSAQVVKSATMIKSCSTAACGERVWWSTLKWFHVCVCVCSPHSSLMRTVWKVLSDPINVTRSNWNPFFFFLYRDVDVVLCCPWCSNCTWRMDLLGECMWERQQWFNSIIPMPF